MLDLIGAIQKTGRYPEGMSFPTGVDYDGVPDNAVSQLAKFQDTKHVNDVPGCAGENTWRAMFANCPFPMTTALCHEPRACVLALQKILFRWVPDGKHTARFCKQTKIQVEKFQRRTISNPMDGVSLNPSGKIKELDFLTLLRRSGIREQRGQPMPSVTTPGGPKTPPKPPKGAE